MTFSFSFLPTRRHEHLIIMWIIAGLGNPGIRYSETRHNIGFRVIHLLSEQCNIKLNKDTLYASGEGLVKGTRVLLVKPLTFMNRSGQAIKNLAVEADKLIVVHDDIDLETGVIKIRKKGSSGGHRGVESIIQQFSTEDFIRVKVGIGRSLDIPIEDYVLDKFTPYEENIIKNAILEASSAVIRIVAQGVDVAMNEFNRPKSDNKQE